MFVSKSSIHCNRDVHYHPRQIRVHYQQTIERIILCRKKGKKNLFYSIHKYISLKHFLYTNSLPYLFSFLYFLLFVSLLSRTFLFTCSGSSVFVLLVCGKDLGRERGRRCGLIPSSVEPVVRKVASLSPLICFLQFRLLRPFPPRSPHHLLTFLLFLLLLHMTLK